MQPDALLAAWLRAVPLALCLPLPGLAARLALGLVLGLVGAGAPGLALSSLRLPHELAIGLMLGLGVAAPVWAARWAGDLIGYSIARAHRPLTSLYSVLAWLAFLAVGGANLLVSAYASSYARYSPGAAAQLDDGVIEAGAALATLAARLALPSLLAIAAVELSAALLARFERGAQLAIDAPSLARGLRPLLVLLLLVASLAAFSQGVGAATRAVAVSPISR